MASIDTTELPTHLPFPNHIARNCYYAFVLYTAFLIFTIFLSVFKETLSPGTQLFVKEHYNFVFTFLTVIAWRESLPMIYHVFKSIHYDIFVYPKLWNDTMEKKTQQYHDQIKQRRVNRSRKQELKQYGEPINLKKWVGKRADSVGKGYVYVLKDIEISHFYKIGKTRKPYERMRAFGVHLPFDVELIHVIECDNADAVERHMHERFADCRRKGEWFDLQPYHIDWLKQYHELNAQ